MKVREVCVFLLLFAYLFLGYALTILEFEDSRTIQVADEELIEEIIPNTGLTNYQCVYLENTSLRVKLALTPIHYNKEVQNLEEYNCLFYATEPLGRYYITAYNHLETGSKLTASGKTCHEGTITTCAADPKYHKFGEYLEIGGRLYVVEDTGSAVKKRHIDVYFASYNQMARYSSHYENIYRVTFPFGKPSYS